MVSPVRTARGAVIFVGVFLAALAAASPGLGTAAAATAAAPRAASRASGFPGVNVRAMEETLATHYPAGEPGAAVIVMREGQVLLRRGFGLADLELGVKSEPDMVYRLGSITKQFTAVAILMLAEEGKLSLADPITRFLPDYPTQGKTITIEHLLTHTSGVRSYTDMPAWLSQWRKDFTVEDLIDFFATQPMEFDPGTQWKYSNSGYILLGAIIEKASGQTYAEFLKRRIFGPLGMTHTRYGDVEPVVPRRVPGYSRGDSAWTNAAYLSMTQPYAAGSLISTVDDMARWNQALDGERLVTRASLERAWTPYRLANGRSTGYGYGWGMGTLQGHRTITHDGGIHGFATAAMRLPDEHVYVAILSNRDDQSPGALVRQLALMALGEAERKPTAISVPADSLEALVGVYRIDERQRRTITREGARLFSQRSGGEKNEIFALSTTEFFFQRSGSRLRFEKGPDGQAARAVLQPEFGPEEVAERTNEAPAPERVVAKVDPARYDRLVGRYELAPGFVLTVTREGDHLMTQATGQSKVEIFPESETRFFLKVVDAQLDFVIGASGAAESLVLHQAGRDVPAKRLP